MEEQPSMPHIFAALRRGFNAIANHPVFILLPLGLDLFLWLGPQLRVSQLVMPFYKELFDAMSTTPGADAASLAQLNQSVTAVISQFNLFVTLRAYPVGVPSLVATALVANSPIGALDLAPVSGAAMAGLATGFGLAGLALGSLFFNVLARHTSEPSEPFSFQVWTYQFGQSLVLALVLVLIVLAISFPVMALVSFLALLSPVLAEMVLLFGVVIATWLLLPLAFCAHGIFVLRQSALQSMLSSYRVVRSAMSQNLGFLLVAIIAQLLLNALWLTPPGNSWMLLVGILGHAFTGTAFLASSFVFYREGVSWASKWAVTRTRTLL